MNRKIILMRAVSTFRLDGISISALGISAGAGLMAATAHGQIFVANGGGGAIGEYTTTGTTMNASLVSGFSNPVGVAVSGSDLFVTDYNNATIGEYTTSGTTVSASLVSGLRGPAEIAVSGSDLFVANQNSGTIGEYTTSGATVNAALVSGLGYPSGIAVSGSDLFVTNQTTGTIGEYTTSGLTVNASLVSGLSFPFGIAVSGSDLFVTNQSTDTIGEYTTSGSTVNAALVSGLSKPVGIALSGSNLFVTNQSSNTIGEYTTSGSTVNAALVSGLSGPFAIAVVLPPLTWNNVGGSGDGMTWDTTSQNWNDGTGPNVYTDTSDVTFDDANNGNYAVTLNTTVSPGSVTVNNSAGSYTLSGAGSIAGAGSLTKMGTGTLTLNTVNTFGGGTTVSAGTLEVGPAGALLNGNITINGGTLQIASGSSISAPTITQNAGTFTDPGALSVAGTGGNAITYNLSGGSASVSGNLQVDVGGNLTQSESGSLTAGSITLTGGAITQNTVGSIITPSLTQTSGTLVVPSLNPDSGIGSYNWSGGTLHLTASNLEIGESGSFGLSLSLPSSQTLIEDVGVTVDPGSSLNLQGGGLTISMGAALNNSGTFNENSGNLTVNGAFINSGTATFGGTQSWGPASVFVNLAGTATFNSAINPGGTGPIIDVTGGNVIYNGGAAALSTTLDGLSIAALGKFDLTNSHLFIHYGGGSNPIASIAAMIASGYAGGAWNGPGIDSSVAAVTPGYGIGYADSADAGNPADLSSGTIEIKYTLLGDANLSGVVDGVDFGIVAANFNKGVSRWDQGDFNYDNVVDGTDFGDLAANFNKGASGASVGGSALTDPALVAFAQANGLMADVPEPLCGSILMMAVAGVLSNRRRG